MSREFKHHMQRLVAGAYQANSAGQVSRWIAENTYIAGKPYSYEDHEYQIAILDDESQEINVRKCSQIGLTEVSIRRSLARCAIYRGYTVAYTLPTAGFAATVMKTRVDPVIEASPYLTSLADKKIDNSEVKRFGDSFFYLRGSQSSNAPISVPCDELVHDELDFSDPECITQYQSRLTHSKYKRKSRFSTPTLPGRGVDLEFQRSRRYFYMAKCSCCNHHFIPDYYEHVRVPDFTGDLRGVTKANLHSMRYNEAFVECPKCGGRPDLRHQHREWVCENIDEHFVAAGYQVSPFDAPMIITPGYLIQASTSYRRRIDFVNFNLGLPAQDEESCVSEAEIRACITQNLDGGFVGFVMGCDMGMMCHITVAGVYSDGAMRVVYVERVAVHEFRTRYRELALQWRVRVKVCDAFPYTETIMALQQEDTNLYGAVYTRSRNTEIFQVRQKDEDREKASQDLRQVNVNRDRAFDSLMEALRSSMISKRTCALDDVWVQQLTDMRRVKDWSAQMQEMTFVWQKSQEGEDHFHHSLLYAWVASQMLGVSRGMHVALPLLSSFKIHKLSHA